MRCGRNKDQDIDCINRLNHLIKSVGNLLETYNFKAVWKTVISI